MTLSQSRVTHQPDYGMIVKSFFLWTGILTVCLLIIGFPAGIVIVSLGSALAMMLHSMMPGLGIAMAAGSIVVVQVVGVMVAAATLALNGVHPSEVSWLPWLQGQDNPQHESVYAACPLTCEVKW